MLYTFGAQIPSELCAGENVDESLWTGHGPRLRNMVAVQKLAGNAQGTVLARVAELSLACTGTRFRTAVRRIRE